MAKAKKAVAPVLTKTIESLRALMSNADSDNQSTLTTSYQVDVTNNPTRAIQMSLNFVPAGILPTSTVKVDSTVVADAKTGAINSLLLGTNQDLDSKFLTIICLINVPSAVSFPATIQLSFSLAGGMNPYSHQLSNTVNQAGLTTFYIDIFFSN